MNNITDGIEGIEMATYTVSDLHGQYKMLLKLLEKVRLDDMKEFTITFDELKKMKG